MALNLLRLTELQLSSMPYSLLLMAPLLLFNSGHWLYYHYQLQKHDSNVLNTIKVKFTPVMPALSSYIAKREALWIGNTLMAYFVDPIKDQTDFASKYDMEKGFTTLGSDADLTEITFSLDKEQKINNVKVQDLANIAPDNTITLVTDRDFNQDGNVTEADRWAYGQELNVKVAATYLGGCLQVH